MISQEAADAIRALMDSEKAAFEALAAYTVAFTMGRNPKAIERAQAKTQQALLMTNAARAKAQRLLDTLEKPDAQDIR